MQADEAVEDVQAEIAEDELIEKKHEMELAREAGGAIVGDEDEEEQDDAAAEEAKEEKQKKRGSMNMAALQEAGLASLAVMPSISRASTEEAPAAAAEPEPEPAETPPYDPSEDMDEEDMPGTNTISMSTDPSDLSDAEIEQAFSSLDTRQTGRTKNANLSDP